MFFFYIDESGNSGTQVHPTEPIHWLVAVAVHCRAIRALEADMLALAVRFFGARARQPDFEFHGSDLFSGRRECHGLAPAARVEIYRSLVSLLARNGCSVFIRGVRKAEQHARAAADLCAPAHPHTLGFQHLVERIDEWLEAQQPEEDLFEAGPDPVLGLLVADEQKEVDREIVRNFAIWRDFGTENQQLTRTIRFLVDTVHYVPSTDSWLLQLADCVSYLRNRYEKVLRGKVLPGLPISPADQEVVDLWREFCEPVVESDVTWP